MTKTIRPLTAIAYTGPVLTRPDRGGSPLRRGGYYYNSSPLPRTAEKGGGPGFFGTSPPMIRVGKKTTHARAMEAP